jgi:hypothetical protein
MKKIMLTEVMPAQIVRRNKLPNCLPQNRADRIRRAGQRQQYQ